MKHIILFTVLLLGGCCPTRIDSFRQLEIFSTAPDHIQPYVERIALLELYDDATDTLYAVDISKSTPRIIQTYPHWNHHPKDPYSK